MKMLSLFIIAAATQGSLALVSKATTHSLPISQDDSQEEVVRVAEPDIVDDASEKTVTPSKALAQTAAKLVSDGAHHHHNQQQASEFTDVKLGAGLVKASEASTETEDDTSVTYASVSPDIVQDSSPSAKAETQAAAQATTDTVEKMEAPVIRDDDVVEEVDADVVPPKKDDQTTQKVEAAVVVQKAETKDLAAENRRLQAKVKELEQLKKPQDGSQKTQNATADVEISPQKSESQMVAPAKQKRDQEKAEAKAVAQMISQKPAEAPKMVAPVEPQKQAEAPKVVAPVEPQKQAEAPKVVAPVVPQKQPEAPMVVPQVVEDGDEDFVEAPIRKANAEANAAPEVEAVVDQSAPVFEEASDDDAVVAAPKRAAAVQVAAAKVHVTAAAPSKAPAAAAAPSKAPAASAAPLKAPAQLKALAISKKSLRGVPDVDENGEEYVDPSQVETTGGAGEEFVAVVPGQLTTDDELEKKAKAERPRQRQEIQRSASKGSDSKGSDLVKPGQVYEADVVTPGGGVSSASAVADGPLNTLPEENRESDTAEAFDVLEEAAEEVKGRKVTVKAVRHQEDCDQGSEFNNNDC
jgi:hypothetical protein